MEFSTIGAEDSPEEAKNRLQNVEILVVWGKEQILGVLTVDADEELKGELKEAISYYFNAKARSVYAELKASRAAARLGLRILPEDLQGEVGEALVGLFEKELGNLLEKAL